MTEKLKFNDRLSATDTLAMSMPTPGFRTEILGFNELGEQLFETHNSMVLGGALYTLEKIFGIKSPLNVEYLNDFMGIATSGPAITEVYPKENVVCLFGIGTGGAGDSITSVNDVKFHEREIINMIPFRLTSDPLPPEEKNSYWFRKPVEVGKTAYFLKQFESQPQIKALWRDAEGDEDGTSVEQNVHTTLRTEPIETFVEMVLKINKKDCREWFEVNGEIEKTRINTIGLFTGVKSTLEDGTEDYKQVKLYSKLNINNEMLTSAKELTIVYRMYTA